MSGHSKWSNIKNRKGAADSARGKVFSDIAKKIRLAVKEGKSGDPRFNPTLRLMLEKARAANMPKENVERAIERGLGHGKGGEIHEVIYEGFAPGGIGLLIVAHSDNLQRTAGEIRSLLTKAGGTLSGPGSVMYMFERAGHDYIVKIPMPVEDPAEQERAQNLIDVLLEDEDVEDVYTAGVWEGQGAEETNVS